MKLVVEKNLEKLNDLISTKFISLVKRYPKAILGLATGTSPIGVYKDIIRKSREQKISFKDVITFNLDEYLDNSDETQSYKYFMNINLFNYLDINKENTNFPSINNYTIYDNLIASFGGIDLQILGIGRDGHIGFNEPNTPVDSETHIALLDERTIIDNSRFFKSIKDVPTKAVTMGLKTIIQSKEIVLIATGKNKAEAIYKMFNNDSDCPASILNNHNNVTIYCDEEAASLLK